MQSTISIQFDDRDKRVSTFELAYVIAHESVYVANLPIIGTLARLLPHCGLSLGKPQLIHYRNVGYKFASAYCRFCLDGILPRFEKHDGVAYSNLFV